MRPPGKHLIAGNSDAIVRRALPAIKVMLAALGVLWLFTLTVNGHLSWVSSVLHVAWSMLKFVAVVVLLCAAGIALVLAIRFWAVRNKQVLSDLACDMRLIGSVFQPILRFQFGLKHAFAVITLLAILLGVAYTPGLHPFLIFFGSLYASGPWVCLLVYKVVATRWPGYERFAVYATLVTLLATALWFAFSSVVLHRRMQLTLWQLTYITLILWAAQLALYALLRDLLTDAPPAGLSRRQFASRGAVVVCCLVVMAFGYRFASDDAEQRPLRYARRPPPDA